QWVFFGLDTYQDKSPAMLNTLRSLILHLTLITFITWTAAASPNSSTPTPDYTIVQRHVHDSTVFTQGLAFHNGRLYESGGLYGESTLRYSTPGETTATMIDLPETLFAE